MTVLFGFALLAVPFASAQDAAPLTSVVSVIGYGEASAPAETATIHITITDGNYGGPPIAQPGATPGARDRESVAGVVAALVDAGIAEGEINVFVGTSVANVGSFSGPARAILQFPLDTPDNARINELVDASAVAAVDESLLVGQVSALFNVADCNAVISQAREAAIADAAEPTIVIVEAIVAGSLRGRVDARAHHHCFCDGPFPTTPSIPCHDSNIHGERSSHPEAELMPNAVSNRTCHPMARRRAAFAPCLWDGL